MRASTAYQSLFTLGAAALMAACASSPPPSPAASPPAAPLAAAASSKVVAPPLHVTAYDWELVSMADREGKADTRWRLPGQHAPRLHFEAGRLTAHNLCNVLSSSYQIQGSTMVLMSGAATKRMCADPALMELEQRLTPYLNSVVNYELRTNAGGPPLLVLHYADGQRLELTGTLTPQARFGGPGERVFLEVAPQRVPCGNPLAPAAQCLQVRELRFADNGVRQSVGQWQPLYGEIEGYAHESGTRNVLRLNRYQLQQPAANTASQAYLLDMVVESERMR